jgi:hypothetical protein
MPEIGEGFTTKAKKDFYKWAQMVFALYSLRLSHGPDCMALSWQPTRMIVRVTKFKKTLTLYRQV